MDVDSAIISFPEIVTGLIVAAATLCISYVFNKIIVPWWRSLIYNGYRVDGNWRVSYTEPILRRKIIFRLVQKGSHICGVSTHTLKDEALEGDYIKQYRLKGEIKDGYLYLVGKHVDKTRLGLAVVMLRVISDGKKMKGWIAAYNSGTSQVEGFQCTTEKI